jgi:dihydrofolate reductase
MRAVVCVNNLGFIGKNNTLMWKSKDDLKHFRRLTTNGNLLAGFKTFKSMESLSMVPVNYNDKHPLIILPENRTVSYDTDYNIEFVDMTYDWCIGGKKTYERYCSLFTELHISHIDNNDIGDTTFPDLSKLNPKCKIFNYYFK